MNRLVASTALVAGLAIGGYGCAIPRGLVEIVNAGAVEHAQQHVAEGNGGEKVLCAIVEDQPDAVGWLIPSVYVATLGCQQANASATASECHYTGLPAVPPFYPNVSCSVLAIGAAPGLTVTPGPSPSVPVLQTQLATDPQSVTASRTVHECVTPSGWPFLYYEPPAGGPVPAGCGKGHTA